MKVRELLQIICSEWVTQFSYQGNEMRVSVKGTEEEDIAIGAAVTII